jgi:hypothetical protein
VTAGVSLGAGVGVAGISLDGMRVAVGGLSGIGNGVVVVHAALIIVAMIKTTSVIDLLGMMLLA